MTNLSAVLTETQMARLVSREVTLRVDDGEYVASRGLLSARGRTPRLAVESLDAAASPDAGV